MEHRLVSAAGTGEDLQSGTAQLSGGQRTLLSLALILAARPFSGRRLLTLHVHLLQAAGCITLLATGSRTNL